MAKLIYPKLSYKIVGICFKIHTDLGNGYQEKYYQRALEKAFIKEKIKYKKEIKVDLKFSDEKIGCYYLDFLFRNRVFLIVLIAPLLFFVMNILSA